MLLPTISNDGVLNNLTRLTLNWMHQSADIDLDPLLSQISLISIISNISLCKTS